MDSRSAPDHPKWGEDALTAFFDLARHNQHATLSQMREARRIVDIDALYLRATVDWTTSTYGNHHDLLYRSHSAYRAAAGLVFATHLPEGMCVARLALECAGYAAVLAENAEAAAAWRARHLDPQSGRRARELFTKRNILSALRKIDRSDVEKYEQILEECIDMGAHPMSSSVLFSSQQTETREHIKRTHSYLDPDPKKIHGTLRLLALVGICCLYVFHGLYRDRFEILGIRHDLLRVREGLWPRDASKIRTFPRA